MTIKCNRAHKIHININYCRQSTMTALHIVVANSHICAPTKFRTPPNKYWSVPNHFVCMMSGFKCNPVRPGTCHKLMVLGILVKRAFHSCGDMMFGSVCLSMSNKFSLEDIHN